MTEARRSILGGLGALADHGLYAVANFVTNVLLAWGLPAADFSVFTIGYAVMLLIGTLHTAFFCEPMLVFAAHRLRFRFHGYLGELLRGHGVLSGAVLLVAAVVGGLLALRDARTAGVSLAIGLLIPTTLLLWLLRRASYAIGRPLWAAAASLIYAAGSIGALAWLDRMGTLSAISALLSLAAAGVIASVPLFIWLRPARLRMGSPARFRRLLVTRHVRLARWTSAAGMLTWVSPNIYYFLLPAAHGIEASGSLRAVLNLVIPFQRFFDALQPMLLPMFARRVRQGTLGPAFRITLPATLGIGALMSLAVALFGPFALNLAYDGEFDAFVTAIYLLIPYPIVMALDTLLGTALVAMERAHWTLRAYACGVASGLLLGVPAAMAFGPEGAAAGVMVSSLTVALVYSWGFASQHQLAKGRRRPATAMRSG